MDTQTLASYSHKISQAANVLAKNASELDLMINQFVHQAHTPFMSSFMVGLTIFILACFVGYYVVWKVTPALHSPLMAVTNAISSVIIIGALIGAGTFVSSISKTFGIIAVILASINIFGGFIVTHRMLQMFSKSKK